jgi:tetrahydrodipicolinate N-succinyltransferase
VLAVHGVRIAHKNLAKSTAVIGRRAIVLAAVANFSAETGGAQDECL